MHRSVTKGHLNWSQNHRRILIESSCDSSRFSTSHDYYIIRLRIFREETRKAAIVLAFDATPAPAPRDERDLASSQPTSSTTQHTIPDSSLHESEAINYSSLARERWTIVYLLYSTVDFAEIRREGKWEAGDDEHHRSSVTALSNQAAISTRDLLKEC